MWFFHKNLQNALVAEASLIFSFLQNLLRVSYLAL